MSEPTPPKIQFPCAYPIKVMGYACQEFRDHVVAVMAKHDDGFNHSETRVRDSRNGKFQSMTVVITARGEAHLQAIFADLKSCAQVQMVL